MATVGQRGHINPFQGRLGLELLLTNVSGSSFKEVARSQAAATVLSHRHSEGKAELGVYTHWTTLRQAKARPHTN